MSCICGSCSCGTPVHFYSVVNPPRACAARVTVVVCVCVHSYLPPHTLESQKRYQQILRNTGIVLNFANFPKNALFKSDGVICLP